MYDPAASIAIALAASILVATRLLELHHLIRRAGAAGARPPRHLEEKNRG
jgi:hypothetical protein